MEQIPFDGTDPIVVMLAWLLTMLLGKLIERVGLERYRAVLPVAAVVLAIGVRVGIDVTLEGPLTWATALRAIASGAVAVTSHAQFREVIKLVASASKEPKTVPGIGALKPPGKVDNSELNSLLKQATIDAQSGEDEGGS